MFSRTELKAYLSSKGCVFPEIHIVAMTIRSKQMTCYQAGIFNWFMGR